MITTGFYRNPIRSSDVFPLLCRRWISLERLVGQLSDKIPPEAALRLWTRNRKSHTLRKNRYNMESKIAAGRRSAVYMAIWPQVRKGLVEMGRCGAEIRYRIPAQPLPYRGTPKRK